MSLRRHATVILLGNSFQTFAPMEAFQHSVHAVINSSEMFMLKQLIEKAVAENDLFSKATAKFKTASPCSDLCTPIWSRERFVLTQIKCYRRLEPSGFVASRSKLPRAVKNFSV